MGDGWKDQMEGDWGLGGQGGGQCDGPGREDEASAGALGFQMEIPEPPLWKLKQQQPGFCIFTNLTGSLSAFLENIAVLLGALIFK